jgi:hypothetical protein
MDARLSWAVLNNAQWCDAVCRAHQIQTSFRPRLWATAERPPRFYPDAVTLRDGLDAGNVVRAISSGPGASVKDSFATLDLGRHGFHELFEARWIAYDPQPPQSRPPRWTVVETEEELADWTTAAGLTEILGAELLHRPDVRFLATRGQEGIRAGAVANVTGPVVGVSNVFTTTIGDEEAWAGIPAAVAALFPSTALVGYEQGSSLRAALRGGFRELGPLRVWVTPG